VTIDGGGHTCLAICPTACPKNGGQVHTHDIDGDGKPDESFCCSCHCGTPPPTGPPGFDPGVDPYNPSINVNNPGYFSPPVFTPAVPVPFPGWNIPYTPITVPQRIVDRVSGLKSKFENWLGVDIIRRQFQIGQAKPLPVLVIESPVPQWFEMRIVLDFAEIEKEPWVPIMRKFFLFVITVMFISATITILRQY
jgi:hypothetical protein